MTRWPRVVLGLQGTQSESNWDRGIARYIGEHVRVLTERGDGFTAYLDAELPPPVLQKRLLSRLEMFHPNRSTVPAVYHVMSPFEPIGIDRIWPAALRRPETRLIVTLYDLIPLIFPEHYLDHPGARLRYLSRLEMIRSADAVLCISEVTARDAIRLLGIPPDRVTVIGAGASTQFQPTSASPEDLCRMLSQKIPGLRPGYFLVTTGLDYRKNTNALILAFANLPSALRRGRQLVIACKIPAGTAPPWQTLAASAGVAEDVVTTGYLPDDTLIPLYQACDLFIFPSLYEGCGLPVLEAIRCGAPVIVSDCSSHPEIVADQAARFNPASIHELTALMARAVTDTAFRAWLRDRGPVWASQLTWDRVGDATATVYDTLLARNTRRQVSAPRPTDVLPWPAPSRPQ